jgi:transposase InsO family protein
MEIASILDSRKASGTTQNELVRHRRFKARTEAIQVFTGYIEKVYRRQRKRVRLGYLTPVTAERQFYGKRLAA